MRKEPEGQKDNYHCGAALGTQIRIHARGNFTRVARIFFDRSTRRSVTERGGGTLVSRKRERVGCVRVGKKKCTSKCGNVNTRMGEKEKDQKTTRRKEGNLKNGQKICEQWC